MLKRIFLLVVYYDIYLRNGFNDNQIQEGLNNIWWKDTNIILESIKSNKKILSIAKNISSSDKKTDKVFDNNLLNYIKSQLGGNKEYYQKYLKYKRKYLMLKNM